MGVEIEKYLNSQGNGDAVGLNFSLISTSVSYNFHVFVAASPKNNKLSQKCLSSSHLISPVPQEQNTQAATANPVKLAPPVATIEGFMPMYGRHV